MSCVTLKSTRPVALALLVDEQPAAENPLERLAVAVALDAPARQDQILAGGLEMQVDAVAIRAQAHLRNGLVAAALEMLGEP